ncbi:hypothetical protein [Sedimenticola sp.]|uniref:hypothetical protein n=1 Tax=Sedimenticola sp. TaxID=1940285 RepID=UPI003D0A3D7E
MKMLTASEVEWLLEILLPPADRRGEVIEEITANRLRMRDKRKFWLSLSWSLLRRM